MVLMKKSIQKRKQQQIKQQQQKQKRSQQLLQQQQQPSVHKKKLQKRVQSKEAPSTAAFAATTVDSLPADDLVSSRSGSETVKRSSGSKAHGISKGSERSKDSSSSSTTLSNKTTKNKKSQGHSKASRAKLISAYEAIVFSESQIPVFWSHDHHGRQQQKATKNLQKQRPKPANLESKASEAMGSANKRQVPKKSKSPVAGDNVDSPLEIKAPLRGNGGAGEGQGHEQLGADELREHLLPQQAKRATPAQDGSSRYHRRPYAPEGISAFLDNTCNSSSGMMISGALVALLLVSFKIYKRTQRQRQMAGLTPPQLDSPSLKAPISPSEL
ncbi:hypothetical protein BGZ67_001196 [Mortierella alpina]|nr:hypothetical protein BGZ67_001196 [Mortierella alpina]